MQLGAIALVLFETILGKFPAEVTHDPVARDLRNHAGSRDGQAVAIAVDDRGLRKWKWKNGKTVDQHVLGRNGKRGERDSHRFMRCSQNINPIDLEMIDNADAPRDFGI